MRTLPQRITLGRDRIIRVEIPAPVGLPEGELDVVVDLTPVAKSPKKGLAALAGIYRGKVKISDDFDEPLEDFADYM